MSLAIYRMAWSVAKQIILSKMVKKKPIILATEILQGNSKTEKIFYKSKRSHLSHQIITL